jgi:hypothetical protein
VGFVVDTCSFTFKRSNGCIHSVVTMPAPSPATAWSYVCNKIGLKYIENNITNAVVGKKLAG